MTSKTRPEQGPGDHAPDSGPTALEAFMGEALLLTIEALEDSQRVRETLPSIATRALFLATKGIDNDDLLNILKPGTAHAVVGRDKKAARHLRSVGLERRQTLHSIQGQAIALLQSARVPKADVARGWAIMLIFDSAGKAVREVRKHHGPFDRGVLQANPAWANEMLVRCFDLVVSSVEEGFEHATQRAEVSHGQTLDTALAARFLYFGASAIVQAMHLPVDPMSAHLNLLNVVYPEIEAYDL